MELMQAKLVRLLSKTPYWFNVFSEQLKYAVASAPRLGADTRVAQATAILLECQEVQIKLSFADFHWYSLHVVGKFWLLVLRESRFLSWSTERLSKPCDLVTVSSLMRSLSPTTWCLRDLGEPVDLKSPGAETFMLSRSPLVKLLLYALVVYKSSSNCLTPISRSCLSGTSTLVHVLKQDTLEVSRCCHVGRFCEIHVQRRLLCVTSILPQPWT